MCTTCGCDGDTPPRLTRLTEGEPHHHDHGHAHAHDGDDPDGHVHHDHAHGGGPRPLAPPGRLPPAPLARTARIVQLEEQVLARNDRLAARNRALFAEQGIVALNLLGGPGAGKTTLLEHTLLALDGEVPLSVIEGDQATLLDAERIRAVGGSVVQVNTGSGCHLDARMVADSLPALAPAPRSVVFIENVGNLVCPALFDLGEHAKVVVLSVTEGEEKPLKYPHVFRASALMLLNKVDLLPHLSFDVERCVAHARQVNPRIQVLQVSAMHGEGMDAWLAWLRGMLARGVAASPAASGPATEG